MKLKAFLDENEQMMLQLTFDSSAYIDAVEVLQGTSVTIIRREFSARILYQGHKENYWQITSNGGEKANKKLDINIVRGPWILGMKGFSELGVSTRLASDDKKELFEKAGKLFNRKKRDYALLIDHIDTERDWFVTEDKDFLRFANQLQPDIIVLQSYQAVERIIQEQIVNASYIQQLLGIVSSNYIAEINNLERPSAEKEQAIQEIHRQVRYFESIQNNK